VKYVHHREALDVKKNNVATDYGVTAIRWGRRQPPFEIVWAAFNLLSQSRRKRAAHHKLPFKAGRQPVTFGQPGREVVAMIAIPGAHLVSVMIVVTATVIVSVPISILIVVLIAMFIVTVAPSLRRKNGIAAQRKQYRSETYPSS
jgi:hypothetical protein